MRQPGPAGVDLARQHAAGQPAAVALQPLGCVEPGPALLEGDGDVGELVDTDRHREAGRQRLDVVAQGHRGHNLGERLGTGGHLGDVIVGRRQTFVATRPAPTPSR